MRIILENEYISTAISSLDLYSRIFIGQYDHLNWEMRLNAIYEKDTWSEIEHKEEVRKTLLMELRNIILPDLQKMGWNASYGIWNFYKNDPRAIDAYDLQQSIRYVDAWFRKPEGDITRNFDKPWIRGRYPEAKVSISGTKEEYKMDIELLPEQFEVLEEAAAVYLHFQKGEFEKLFSVYTDKPEALAIAKNIESLNVSLHPDIIERAEKYFAKIKSHKKTGL